MRAVRFGGLLVLLAVTLSACFWSSAPQRTYGISWRLEPTDAFGVTMAKANFIIPLLEAVAQANGSYVESAVASGYWIPDPDDPLGMIVALQAWVQEGGTRRPTSATWSVEPAAAGEFSHQTAAETQFRPSAPGTYTIRAVIGNTVLEQPLEVYPGFVLESADILEHGGGIGFRFDLEAYVPDPTQADIFVEADGTIHVPAGFVYVDEEYLHEISGPVPMVDVLTSIDFYNARLGVLVLETRTGEQVALHLGVTASGLVGGQNGYAYVFGYKRL